MRAIYIYVHVNENGKRKWLSPDANSNSTKLNFGLINIIQQLAFIQHITKELF